MEKDKGGKVEIMADKKVDEAEAVKNISYKQWIASAGLLIGPPVTKLELKNEKTH